MIFYALMEFRAYFENMIEHNIFYHNINITKSE